MRVPSLPFAAIEPVNGHIPYYVCWPRDQLDPDIRQEKPDGVLNLSELSACQYQLLGAEHLQILQELVSLRILLTSDTLLSGAFNGSALRDQCQHIEAYLGSLINAQGSSSLANIAGWHCEFEEVEWSLGFLGLSHPFNADDERQVLLMNMHVNKLFFDSAGAYLQEIDRLQGNVPLLSLVSATFASWFPSRPQVAKPDRKRITNAGSDESFGSNTLSRSNKSFFSTSRFTPPAAASEPNLSPENEQDGVGHAKQD